MSRTPVGEIRPSQLLWTYGPGALIDLPNMSVVTMGIDRWEKDRCQPIQEARLLVNVRSVLGPQVDSLRMPPIPTSATRGQNACNVLIFRSCKPKVGTTRHGAEERGRGAQTQIRGGGWAGKFSLSC